MRRIDVAKNLREWRQERLMSIADLAAAAGVSTKTLVQVEHGRQRPQWRTMRALCKALDVQPRDVAEFAAAMDAEPGHEEAAA
jgi:DNA-binding XRE family transcriptional regulator